MRNPFTGDEMTLDDLLRAAQFDQDGGHEGHSLPGRHTVDRSGSSDPTDEDSDMGDRLMALLMEPSRR